ncbi:MAG: 50S ribosomal protein L23 [Candidatus Rokubacteria bacterium]|nr:50S ribosomal protein L23 [Chloroflexota bacterium]MBM4443401.1 50S ribosomal protein L23 [Candidatus Rokubacteria bacterium]
MPKALHVYEVLRRPIVTEKSTALAGQGKYVFEVAKGANKPQIKEAVERAFNVNVTAVNTTIMRGRRRRNRYGRRTGPAPSWKKAIVTLQSGQQIQLYEGV